VAAPLLAVLLGLALLYRYGPSRDAPRWRWVTPGGALAAVFWLVASALFSWYVDHFGSYNKTYGSLGAAIGFMTWIWLSTMIVLAGARPVFVDIAPDTCNIDASLIEAKITPRTKAIMPVSLYGQVADMVEIIAIAAVAGDDEAQLAPGLVIGGGEADATFVEAGLEMEQILIDTIEEDQGLGCAHPIDD
jgi:hypothetical protein